MSKRYEFGTADQTPVELVIPADFEEEFGYEPDKDGNFALTIGNAWASAYAVEGSLPELREFVAKLAEQVGLPVVTDSGTLRACTRCGDLVQYLFSADLCDGCAAEPEPAIAKGVRVAYQVMYSDGQGFGRDHIVHRTHYGTVTRIRPQMGSQGKDRATIRVEDPKPGSAKYVERYTDALTAAPADES
jgi:hypothetical protein